MLIGISACVCSGLSLPIVLLWVYMFHMRCFACSLLHWYILNITFFCLICCAAPLPPPSLSFSSDLTIFPCLNKYIYISFVLCLSLWIRCEFILLPSFASLLSLPSIWYGYMCYLLRHKKKQREKCSDPTVALLLPSVISM